MVTPRILPGRPQLTNVTVPRGRLDLADALGDRFLSWNIRTWLGITLYMLGDLDDAGRVFHPLAEEGAATGDLFMTVLGNIGLARVHTYQGRPAAALGCGETALAAATAMGGWVEDTTYAVLANAALAGGDGPAAKEACEASWRHTVPERVIFTRSLNPMAEALLACGELVAARKWADETAAMVPGWHKMVALMERAYIALAQGEPEQAERDTHEALTIAVHTNARLRLPDIVECLARLAVGDGHPQTAARLFGAADAIRQRIGVVRFAVYQTGYNAAIESLRDVLGEAPFDAAWAQGAALSIEETIAYAKRGRGERKSAQRRMGMAHTSRARRCAARERRARQQRHRRTPFHLTPDRANPPHSRLHQTRPDLPGPARPRSSPPHLTPVPQGFPRGSEYRSLPLVVCPVFG